MGGMLVELVGKIGATAPCITEGMVAKVGVILSPTLIVSVCESGQMPVPEL